MKRNFLPALFCVYAFSLAVFSQTIVITPKETAYKRPKPYTEYKKGFTIIYPKVKGTTAVLAKKIENTISYEKVFAFDLKKELDEIQWLEEASYKIDYNKKGVLGIVLTMSGSGAYPTEYDRPVVVNLQSGERIKPADVFIKLDELAALCKIAQQAEITKAIADIKKDVPEEENPSQLFKDAGFTVKDLNEFSVSDKGVTFWYHYGFPHVITALQPEGRFFFSFAELKPYIKSGGVFGKYVR